MTRILLSFCCSLEVDVAPDTFDGPLKRKRYESEEKASYREWVSKYTSGYTLHPDVETDDIMAWVACEGEALSTAHGA